MGFRPLLAIATLVLMASIFGGSSGATSASFGNVPQGTQTDKTYAQSAQKAGVTNVFF